MHFGSFLDDISGGHHIPHAPGTGTELELQEEEILLKESCQNQPKNQLPCSQRLWLTATKPAGQEHATTRVPS